MKRDALILATLLAFPFGVARAADPHGGEGIEVYMALLQKKTCDSMIPAYQAETAEAYARWRHENQAVIGSLENDPQLRQDLDQVGNGSQDPEARRWLPAACDLLAKQIGAKPPDPRFSTAKKAWELFVDALRKNDKDLAVACLRPGSDQAGTITEASPAEMAAMANAFREFVPGEPAGDVQKASVYGHQKGFILVEFENLAGEWKLLSNPLPLLAIQMKLEQQKAGTLDRPLPASSSAPE